MDSKTLQTLRRDAEDICRSAIEASVPDAAIQRALAQLQIGRASCRERV